MRLPKPIIFIPITLLFLPHDGGNALLGFTVGLAVFVFWAHRTNISRILKGEENKFGRMKAEAESQGGVTP